MSNDPPRPRLGRDGTRPERTGFTPGRSNKGQAVVRGVAGESITWLELFFDLVAVAAMVVLASALEEHTTWAGVGVFSVTFAAIWMCWSSLALYVNLANEAAEKRTIILGMAAIAAMAASLLHLDEHANVFAIAFLICRWFTARASLRTGRLLANWPALQLGGLTAPWLISLWIDGPTKYWYWAAGIAFDLIGQVLQRDADEEVLARINERSARDRARGEIRPTFVTTDVRGHHLEERLGTFVIIVLGESVLQMVRAVSETHWSASMWVAAGAGFAILVMVWRLTFSYGFATAPGARMAELSLRLSMPVHLISSGSLVVFAASLGELIRESGEHVPPVWGWLAAGSLAVYFAISLLAGVIAKAPRAWILGRALPAVVVALALGAVGPHLDPAAFIALLAIPVAWQVAYGFGGRTSA